MNTSSLRLARALLFAATALLAPSAWAFDKVSVAVQVHGEDIDKPGAKGKEDRNDTSQSKTLEIRVSNSTREALNDLKVKYTYLGFDQKDDETVKVDSGEEKVSLAPNGSQMVKAKSVNFTSTRAHADVSRSGKGKNSKSTAKRVDATGTKYKGYGVQVFQGETMVGEAYSSPEMKKAL